MPELLLYQLYGPMVSWGEAAVGEVRNSYNAPSKSAVVGMVACALGITRQEEQRLRALQDSLGFGLWITHPGHILLDYHTAQVPHGAKNRDLPTRRDELAQDKLNTVLSSRTYLCDARAIIALWRADGADDEAPTLAQIKAALLEPKFTLYLGRKSCPLALPLEPQLIEAASLKAAFEHARFDSFTASDLPTPSPKRPQEVRWEAGPIPSGFEPLMTQQRSDVATSRKRWQFTSRHEHIARWSPQQEAH